MWKKHYFYISNYYIIYIYIYIKNKKKKKICVGFEDFSCILLQFYCIIQVSYFIFFNYKNEFRCERLWNSSKHESNGCMGK